MKRSHARAMFWGFVVGSAMALAATLVDREHAPLHAAYLVIDVAIAVGLFVVGWRPGGDR